MHGSAPMLACRLCCWPLAAVLACGTRGWWPPEGSAEDSPPLHCSTPRWPGTPSPALPPAALKDTQADRRFRVQCLCPFVTQTNGVTSQAQWISHACGKSLVCWLHPPQSQHDPRAGAGIVHALMALATSVNTRQLGLWRAP